MEGRLQLHQTPDGSSSDKTPTTRLKANFKVSDQPGVSSPPGLWIGTHVDSGASSSVQINANLRDSTCFNPDPPLPPKVTELKDRLQPNFVYQSTPGDNFPSLPAEEISPIPEKGPTVYPLSAIEDSLSLPENTQTADEDGILSYEISKNDEKSINLTNGKILKIEKKDDIKTVVLYLKGGIALSNSKIELASDTKLVIHALGPVVVSGNSQIKMTSKTIALYLDGGMVVSENSQIALMSDSESAIYTQGPLTVRKDSQIGVASGSKLAIHAYGSLAASENSKIELSSDSKLTIYAHGPVTLAGNSTTPAIKQLASTPSSANAKLFVYTPSDVNLSGSAPLSLFVLAPNSKVTSSAKVEGSIWSKSWIGMDAAAIHQDIEKTTDLELKVSWPIKILPITAWQQCVVPFPSERESDLPTCQKS
ncbi:MAG: hypothetical protein WCD18_22990 [Thermosynechococcaceae cyanobacterium]